MARMFGLSRTRAAALIAEGHVEVDGHPAGKSDRVHAGAMLDVTIPSVADPLEVEPELVEGIRIIHDDDSIVVLDKPVGIAVHPSPGWSGPTGSSSDGSSQASAIVLRTIISTPSSVRRA